MSFSRALVLFSWLLFLAAPQASAFSYSMTSRTPTSGLSVGDPVVVDVFFDADQPDVLIASVAVVGEDVLRFDPVASALLPVIYPAPPASAGTNGSQPGYILHSPGAGDVPATWLESFRSPWIEWPGLKPPGTVQVNVDYLSNQFLNGISAKATGTGIWVGSLLFEVGADFATSEIQLAFTSSNVLALFTEPDIHTVIDPADIGLSSPIVLTGTLPEPTTATLIALGLAVSAATRPRRRPGADRSTPGPRVRIAPCRRDLPL